jgi:exosortase
MLAGYFFWRRWPELRPARIPDLDASRAWGFLFLLVVLAGPIELLRQTPLYWRPILWAMGALAVGATLAATFLTGGRTAVRGLLFPTCFPLIGIPWPGQVEIGTTVLLQGWVAVATGDILNWLGVAAVVEGKTIRVANCVLGVEEACSGLQSLQSSIMVALAGGEVFRRGIRTRCALLAWGVGVALAGNLIRAVILGLIGARSGPERVEHWHNLLGMGILLAVVLVVWWAASRDSGVGPEQEHHAKKFLYPEQGRKVGLAALAWLLVSGGLVHAWYARPQTAGHDSLLVLGSGAVREEVPAEVAGVLRPTEGTYVRGQEGTVGYHFWWGPSRGNANQLYHRPDACMPGAGWRQSGPTQELVLKLKGRETVWTAFPYERPGQEAVLLWAVWLDGEPLRLGAYDQNRQVYLQRELLAEFVKRGKRIFSFEVAACLIPGQEVKMEEAERALGEMFAWREQDGVR